MKDFNSAFPEIIKGKEIYLKKPEATFEFANKMFAVIDNDRQNILPWLDWALPENTKSAEDDFIYALDADQKWKAGERYEFAIYKSATHDYLGNISLARRGDLKNRCFEIGFWLRTSARGQGYMLQAVGLLEETAFRHGAKRLIIRNNTQNQKSANVAVRAGYQFEGIEKCGAYSEADKTFYDVNVFSKIAEF